jgi:hypothetical protein
MAEEGISQSTAWAQGHCRSVCLRESQIGDDERGTKVRKWGGKNGGGREESEER